MSEIHPAPVLHPPVVRDDKWNRERRAFLRMLPALLDTHPGKYVAVHEGEVVGTGDDVVGVAQRAYASHGYVPIYVGQVTVEPPGVVRMPSPRVLIRG